MPNVNIPGKVCSHCNDTKWLEYKIKVKGEVITRWTCAIKRRETNRRYEKNNPEKLIEYRKRNYLIHGKKYQEKFKGYRANYYLDNKEKILEYSRKWEKNNPERYKELVKRKDKKAIDNLSDRYLKLNLSNYSLLHYSEIPQYLIELKRKQLLLYRQIH